MAEIIQYPAVPGQQPTQSDPAEQAIEVSPGEKTRPEQFSREVHESLKALQYLAAHVKSRHDPGLRRATPDELALAELQHVGKNYCVAHSRRTGLPCRRRPIAGGKVCARHCGNTRHIREAADRRVLEMSAGAMGEMYRLAMLPVDRWTVHAKQKAAADLLDRAGVGAVGGAKVR